MLPWRKEVIRGMLGADVLGFQVPEDVANFAAAAERLVDARTRGHSLFDGVHVVDVDAFPISVDFAHWDSLGDRAAPEAAQNREELGGDSILLGIDRLDYTKGISQRLRAFGELLDEGLLDTEKCTFVQVAVPSRADVAAYEDEREEVENADRPRSTPITRAPMVRCPSSTWTRRSTRARWRCGSGRPTRWSSPRLPTG